MGLSFPPSWTPVSPGDQPTVAAGPASGSSWSSVVSDCCFWPDGSACTGRAVSTSTDRRSTAGVRPPASVVLVAALGLLLVAGGVAVLLDPTGSRRAGEVEAQSRDVGLPPYRLEPVTHLQHVPARPDPAVGPPVQVIVGGLRVDAPVVPISLQEATLLPPDDPQTIGWWSGGARPGSLRGATVLTGHTVHTGGGAFDRLDTLRAGAPVSVRTARGTIRYRVTAVRTYRRASLARDADRVFGQQGPARLVLVTCDDWNGVRYLSNAVVFADPV